MDKTWGKVSAIVACLPFVVNWPKYPKTVLGLLMYTPTMEVCPRAANHSSAEASRLKFAGVMKLLIVDDHEIL
jgi:hypothetical protein